jgi:hypothetical protein
MPRTVDGVIRRSAPELPFAPRPLAHERLSPPAPLLKQRSADASRTRRGAQADSVAQPVVGQSAVGQRLSFEAPEARRPRRRWYKPLLFPLAVLACMSASFLVQSEPIGVAAIAVYGVVAWFKRIPARTSFIMALVSLAAVILLLVVRQNVQLAGNFSTYTFLLLVVGIFSAVREGQAHPKRRNSKIPNLRRKTRL